MHRIFLVCFILILAHTVVSAKHIIGGDVYYTCVFRNAANNVTRFKIDVVMYRDPVDPTAADFNNDALFGIWRNTGSGWQLYQDRSEDFRNRENVDLNDINPCIIVPPDVGVQKAEYSFEVDLPNIDGEYLIAYQRCCRNNTISNIIDPQSTGAVFAVTISADAQTSCNNSPRFKEFPPVVICNGLDLVFDHSTTDVEGDLVTYEFCAPRASGGIDGSQNTLPANTCTGVTPSPTMCPPPWGFVQYQAPLYSVTNPLGGAPQVTIDPNTGIITGVPSINGQFVVGVCAKEYRNGILIGEIRRDFQFNVTTCEPSVFAVIQHDELIGQKEFVINSCGNTTVDFENESYNIEYITGYDWKFDINGQIENITTRNATVNFPSIGQYQGEMIVNPDTDCADTAVIYVNIYPEVVADFIYQFDTCVAGPVVFEDLSYTGASNLTDWEWDFDPASSSSDRNPVYQYPEPGIKNVSLLVTDNNNCTDTIVQEIVWQPAPGLLVVEPTRFVGCAPSDIFFNNLSEPINEDYIIEWDFGDGGFSGEISPTYQYMEPGIYSVNLKITSPIGCEIERSYNNYIRIEESPIADFIFSPTEVNNFNSLVSFTDLSIDAERWQWNFGGQGNSNLQNPTHTFVDTGLYDVQLVVRHMSGCTDTAVARIDVVPQVTYHVPNAFSPNNDGRNDVFIGKGYLEAIRDFQMQIFNRWGEQVYLSTDQSIGWNGSKNNTGSPSPQGVYVYVITYTGPRGGKEELKGHVTLLR